MQPLGIPAVPRGTDPGTVGGEYVDAPWPTGPAGPVAGSSPSLGPMCRNITVLRGLEPPATPDEVEAAARQYVRKVGGVQAPSATTSEAVDRAVRAVAEATAALLAELPARRRPPTTEPPLRRLARL